MNSYHCVLLFPNMSWNSFTVQSHFNLISSILYIWVICIYFCVFSTSIYVMDRPPLQSHFHQFSFFFGGIYGFYVIQGFINNNNSFVLYVIYFHLCNGSSSLYSPISINFLFFLTFKAFIDILYTFIQWKFFLCSLIVIPLIYCPLFFCINSVNMVDLLYRVVSVPSNFVFFSVCMCFLINKPLCIIYLGIYICSLLYIQSYIYHSIVSF